jgi:hypothetical protein
LAEIENRGSAEFDMFTLSNAETVDNLALLPQHLGDLRASGLSDKSITAAGLYSVTDGHAIANILRWHCRTAIEMSAVWRH